MSSPHRVGSIDETPQYELHASLRPLLQHGPRLASPAERVLYHHDIKSHVMALAQEALLWYHQIMRWSLNLRCSLHKSQGCQSNWTFIWRTLHTKSEMHVGVPAAQVRIALYLTTKLTSGLATPLLLLRLR